MGTPERIEIRKEAIARQGTTINGPHGRYRIEGDQKRAKFQMGEEGLVHWATEEGTGARHRIKLFWEPDDIRLERSRYLVKQGLANKKKGLDVLAGAPFALLESIGGLSRFALIMRNVDGGSWKDLRQDAETTGVYPPQDWPSLETRLLWAYGLASAVERMEARKFVHADLSDGNIVVVSTGTRAGGIALVDFDAYFNPTHTSNYRGTNGFVAPEIWNRGAIGVGSDRVAMAILIQEFLISGDPELSSNDAFEERYTQDQICSLECRAHPLLRSRYGAVADLVDATLRASTREGRPAPALWREPLLSLYRQSPASLIRLTESRTGTQVSVSLSVGEKKDLMQTLLPLEADIVRRSDGTLILAAHPGAGVRFQTLDSSWRTVVRGEEVTLTNNSRLSDPDGRLQALLTMLGSTEARSETASTLTPQSFDEPAPRPGPAIWINWAKDSISQINMGRPLLVLLACLLLAISVVIGRRITLPPHPIPSTTQPTKARKIPPPPPEVVRPAPVPPISVQPPTPSPVLPAEARRPTEERAAIPPRAPAAGSRVKQARVESPAAVPQAAISPATNQAAVPPVLESRAPTPPVAEQAPASHPTPPPIQVPRETPPPAYSGPSSGDVVWSGVVEKNQLIEIKDGRVNVGTLSGRPLPGLPVAISINTDRLAVVSQPNPLNHFAAVTFRSSFSGHIALVIHWALLPTN